MKRFFVLAVIPGLVFGLSLTADDVRSQDIVILNQFDADHCPTVPVQVLRATPVVTYSAPQTVRRFVPRTTYQTVTKTIMVPTTQTEIRQSQSVEYRDEVHERSVTVYDQVPVTRQVTMQSTVLVPQTRQRRQTYSVQVPFERMVEETYTVDKVHTETRTRKQTVSRCVPTTEMRTVTTGGEIVKRAVKSDLGGVRARTEVVGGHSTQEAVTVMRRQLVEQTIEYDVEVTRPETRTRMVKVTDYRTETQTRSVPETVHVSRVEPHTQQVTEMRSVPRQTTETYTVRVPHVVSKPVQVSVTKMVAQQVTEQVPVTTYDVIEEPVSNCVAY